MQVWKNRLSNNNNYMIYWRRGDFTLFLLGFIFFFGVGAVMVFVTYNPILRNCVTDWWVLPMGIGFVFLFLFVICKKVE